MIEFRCQDCAAWVISYAFGQMPDHGLICFRCACLREMVSDPVERAEIERRLDDAERREWKQ
jgi:hypothetical protein